MESERLASNERVEGSSPSVPSILDFRFWIWIARSNRPDFSSKPKSRIPHLRLFRGRLIGRTVGSEPANRGSNPLPEAFQI